MVKTLNILILFSCFTLGQRADFYREDITFRLDSSCLNVEGYYWFANHFDKEMNSEIYYPFPNYLGGSVDSIRLFNISTGTRSHFKWESDNGISFLLKIAPLDTVFFQIGYRQKIIADCAIYILRTTQGWGKPIDLAEYKLIVPDSFIIKRFSYPPDKTYEIVKNKIFYWKKENFMPERDMIFYF